MDERTNADNPGDNLAREEEQTYGVYLNVMERNAFERILGGLTATKAADALSIPRGLMRAMMVDGSPLRRAIHAANAANWRAAMERRDTLLSMSMEELQDQLSDPATPKEAKREIAYQVLDRFGAPKVLATKASITHSGNVNVIPASVSDLEAQLRRIAAVKQAAIEVIPVTEPTE